MSIAGRVRRRPAGGLFRSYASYPVVQLQRSA